MTTTSYGTWANHGDGEIDLETNVGVALGDFAGDYNLPGLIAAYRDAINAALPEGISLHGAEFYGPAYPDVPLADKDPEDGLAEERIPSAIRAAIQSVDFWVLAAQHETTA